MSKKNGNGVNLRLLGKVNGRRREEEEPQFLRMAYVVPSNRWCLVDATQPFITMFVVPTGSGVLLPGDENRPVPGMMDLAILTATLSAEGNGYRRDAATGFAVPKDSVAQWAQSGPPDVVRGALADFVMDDGWPAVEDPLVFSLGLLMPPSYVITRSYRVGPELGGECAFPDGVV